MSITTRTELDTLPVGSVVLGDDGRPWQCDKKPFSDELVWRTIGSHANYDSGAAGLLPATVISTPGQTVWPNREAVLNALGRRWWERHRAGKGWEDLSADERGEVTGNMDIQHLADMGLHVMSLLPGRTETAVKSEALHEAASVIMEIADHGGDSDASPHETAAWLIARGAQMGERFESAFWEDHRRDMQNPEYAREFALATDDDTV